MFSFSRSVGLALEAVSVSARHAFELSMERAEGVVERETFSHLHDIKEVLPGPVFGPDGERVRKLDFHSYPDNPDGFFRKIKVKIGGWGYAQVLLTGYCGRRSGSGFPSLYWEVFEIHFYKYHFDGRDVYSVLLCSFAWEKDLSLRAHRPHEMSTTTEPKREQFGKVNEQDEIPNNPASREKMEVE